MPIAVDRTLTHEPAYHSDVAASRHWSDIAKKKVNARDRLIPDEWRLASQLLVESQIDVTAVPRLSGILSEAELEITETAAEVLVAKLLSGKVSSYHVTLAFCKRAAIAQQLTNCLTEIFFDEALGNAKSLDEHYSKTGIPAGPLHGLPVSLKDCFQVEGYDSTIGYTANIGHPALKDEESEITKVMRKTGAILFCKTNVPTAMMSGESYNNIFGYTTNPYNRNLSSGGSSGGESALIALKGSPLGVGTDVGGSVRIPASWCGLYSLKPSYGRFPLYGVKDGLDGQEAVRNTAGPLASSLAAIKMWSKAVIDTEPWLDADPHCLAIPWREIQLPQKLCFGLLLDDGIVKPLPPVTRALLETKAALEAAGHTVIEFSIHDPLYTDELKFAMYRSAGARLLGETLAKTSEPWPRGYEMLQAMIEAGDVAPPPVDHIPNGFPLRPIHIPATVSELWVAQGKRTVYAKQVLESWAATKLYTETGREMDALLSPCTPGPATPKYTFTYDNYTSLWNVLDYCATTLPVTQVCPEKDAGPSYEGRNGVEKQVWSGYSPETYRGAPVSIQLVGRRLHEEKLLEVTRACDEAVKAYNTDQF